MNYKCTICSMPYFKWKSFSFERHARLFLNVKCIANRSFASSFNVVSVQLVQCAVFNISAIWTIIVHIVHCTLLQNHHNVRQIGAILAKCLRSAWAVQHLCNVSHLQSELFNSMDEQQCNILDDKFRVVIEHSNSYLCCVCLRICVSVYLCSIGWTSSAVFRIMRAGEVVEHSNSYLCNVYLCIYVFVYLCICVFVYLFISVFAILT